MKKIKLGVVGLGHRGREMFKLACNGFDFVEAAAACDLISDNWYKKQWLSDMALSEMFPGAVFYDDYDEMLESAGLDAVLIETGADIHAEFCCRALEKNINVLSDIPVVASIEEANKLWKVAKKSKAMFSTGANPNEAKFSVMLKDFYERGFLGKPYYMEAEYIHWSLPGSEMHTHLNENGDWRKLLIPIRYCTHSLGPILNILNEELRYVSCFGTGLHADDYPEGEYVDDMMSAQFKTESGVVVRLLRNHRCRAQIGHHNYRVFGTEGYMERTDRFNKPVILYNSQKNFDTGLKEVSGEFMPPKYANNPKAMMGGHDGIDYALLDHFFDALLNGKEPPISLREGLAMTLPGIYAEESAKQNGKVLRMAYPWDED